MARLNRCIPEFCVSEMAKIVAFLTGVVGFEVDPCRFDDADPDQQRFLEKGDIKIRLYSADHITNSRPGETSLVFECDNSQYWNDLLRARGFQPVFCREIGAPLTVTCYITDDFEVHFEEVGTESRTT